jgi:hypothetical protein
MLHVANGDMLAASLRVAEFDGDVLSWREAMINGPAPKDVDDDTWIAMRADHLARTYDVDRNACASELQSMLRRLDDAIASNEEIVLWFDADLFCQVHLLFILDRIAESPVLAPIASYPKLARDWHPTEYHALHKLDRDELGRAFDARVRFDAPALELARAAWHAFSSDDPRAIEALLADDTSALPDLRDAMLHHLERFPRSTNGLNRIQDVALRTIAGGTRQFPELFRAFQSFASAYGYGDAQLWNELRALAGASKPLVTITGNASNAPFESSTFELTETGRAVLEGRLDHASINELDVWIGGVHLHGSHPIWRWTGTAITRND